MKKLVTLLFVSIALYGSGQGTSKGVGMTKIAAKENAIRGVYSRCERGYSGVSKYDVSSVMFEKGEHMWTCLVEYKCK